MYPRSSFSSVAATSLPSLLLCCCCCAAAPVLLLLCRCFCCSTIRDASRRTIGHADAQCIIRTRIPKKSPASVFHFLHLAFWFDPGCWGQKQQLDVVATTTAAVLLLLCCCCCAAAAVLLENIALPHRTTSSSFPTCKISQGDTELKGLVKCCCCCGAPSAAPCDPRFSPREKKIPLRCSISFVWRSGLPRGAVTKNSNFTVPRRVEEL